MHVHMDVTKTRNGERGTGNGERGTGNGERKSGNELSAVTSTKIQNGGMTAEKGQHSLTSVERPSYLRSDFVNA